MADEDFSTGAELERFRPDGVEMAGVGPTTGSADRHVAEDCVACGRLDVDVIRIREEGVGPIQHFGRGEVPPGRLTPATISRNSRSAALRSWPSGTLHSIVNEHAGGTTFSLPPPSTIAGVQVALPTAGISLSRSARSSP